MHLPHLRKLPLLLALLAFLALAGPPFGQPSLTSAHHAPPTISIDDIITSPALPNTLLLQRRRTDIYHSPNIYSALISRNGGATWSALPTTPWSDAYAQIALTADPTGAPRVVSLVGTHTTLPYTPGAYLTSNLGRSWTTVPLQHQPPPCPWLYTNVSQSADTTPAAPRTIYLREAKGGQINCSQTEATFHTSEAFVRSTDGGATWTQLPAVGYGELYASPTEPGLLYHARIVQEESGQRTLWRRSSDGGTTWQDLNWSGLQMYGMLFDSQNASALYARDDTLAWQRTTDGGASWQALASPCPEPLNNGTIVFADPATEGILYARCGDAALYRSADRGATWTTLEGAPNGLLRADHGRPGRILATHQGTQIWASEDHGDTWTLFASFSANETMPARAYLPVVSW